MDEYFDNILNTRFEKEQAERRKEKEQERNKIKEKHRKIREYINSLIYPEEKWSNGYNIDLPKDCPWHHDDIKNILNVYFNGSRHYISLKYNHLSTGSIPYLRWEWKY
jgi:hypothetical protein